MADRYYTGLRLGHNERVYSVIDEDTGEVRFLGGGGFFCLFMVLLFCILIFSLL